VEVTGGCVEVSLLRKWSGSYLSKNSRACSEHPQHAKEKAPWTGQAHVQRRDLRTLTLSRASLLVDIEIISHFSSFTLLARTLSSWCSMYGFRKVAKQRNGLLEAHLRIANNSQQREITRLLRNYS
jgi:hypothetical protein